MRSRQPSGSRPKCWRSDALYIMKRRLMNNVVSTAGSAGVPEARSCAAATREAPAKTASEISMAMAGAMPLATIATPVITPKAMTPGSTGKAARAPVRKLLVVIADAGLQFFAALVLAGFADPFAPGHAFLAGGFALARILRRRAHLLHHALVVLGAALAFARGARTLHAVLRLAHALFAALRILRLGAHLLQHAFAMLRAGLAMAGLLSLGARGLHLVAPLLPGLAILAFRPIEPPPLPFL